MSRQSPHHDRWLGSAATIINVLDPKVDVGGQAPVEIRFTLARLPPQFRG